MTAFRERWMMLFQFIYVHPDNLAECFKLIANLGDGHKIILCMVCKILLDIVSYYYYFVYMRYHMYANLFSCGSLNNVYYSVFFLQFKNLTLMQNPLLSCLPHEIHM